MITNNFNELLDNLTLERSEARNAGNHEKAEAICEVINLIMEARRTYVVEVEEV